MTAKPLQCDPIKLKTKFIFFSTLNSEQLFCRKVQYKQLSTIETTKEFKMNSPNYFVTNIQIIIMKIISSDLRANYQFRHSLCFVFFL